MKEENARIALQKAEAQIGMMRIRLNSQSELLKAARLQLTAATNELKRYRKANLLKRMWRTIFGCRPKGCC